jgi:hypothetical protein
LFIFRLEYIICLSSVNDKNIPSYERFALQDFYESTNGDNWIYQISVLHAGASVDGVKTFLSKEDYENFFIDFSPE